VPFPDDRKYGHDQPEVAIPVLGPSPFERADDWPQVRAAERSYRSNNGGSEICWPGTFTNRPRIVHPRCVPGPNRYVTNRVTPGHDREVVEISSRRLPPMRLGWQGVMSADLRQAWFGSTKSGAERDRASSISNRSDEPGSVGRSGDRQCSAIAGTSCDWRGPLLARRDTGRTLIKLCRANRLNSKFRRASSSPAALMFDIDRALGG